ncbi:hypothetical protein OAJ50_05080 [Candidatus Nitrosopelagicus sp.]|nr:hypothetical protein [Candidatus Nitrosopelagicus sp.]
MTIDDSVIVQGIWLTGGMIVGFFSSIFLVRQFRKWEKKNWREPVE